MYMYIYCCRSIVYEKSLTLFRVHEPPFHAIIRNVTLSNQFDFPVVIYSAKLSLKALDYYSVSVHVRVCVDVFVCLYMYMLLLSVPFYFLRSFHFSHLMLFLLIPNGIVLSVSSLFPHPQTVFSTPH